MTSGMTVALSIALCSVAAGCRGLTPLHGFRNEDLVFAEKGAVLSWREGTNECRVGNLPRGAYMSDEYIAEVLRAKLERE